MSTDDRCADVGCGHPRNEHLHEGRCAHRRCDCPDFLEPEREEVRSFEKYADAAERDLRRAGEAPTGSALERFYLDRGQISATLAHAAATALIARRLDR